MTVKTFKFLASTLYVGTLALVVGCDDGPQFAAASGTVLLDGKPLEGAAVMYVSTGSGPVATGVTDGTGRFSLKTLEREGAVVGKYRVSITKQVMRGFDDSDPTRPGLIPIIEWQTLKRYARTETSQLSAEVGPHTEEPTFQLVSKEQ